MVQQGGQGGDDGDTCQGASCLDWKLPLSVNVASGKATPINVNKFTQKNKKQELSSVSKIRTNVKQMFQHQTSNIGLCNIQCEHLAARCMKLARVFFFFPSAKCPLEVARAYCPTFKSPRRIYSTGPFFRKPWVSELSQCLCWQKCRYLQGLRYWLFFLFRQRDIMARWGNACCTSRKTSPGQWRFLLQACETANE